MTRETGGRSAQPPVVLLHPLASDHTFWQRVEAGLAGSRQLLVPDLAGHGSGPPLLRGATIQDFTEDIVRRLDLARASVVDLVGVSLGGLVAQDIAIRYPARIRRLVLADTVPSYPVDLRSGWLARAATARGQGLAALADAMEDMWFSKEFRRREPGVVAESRRVLLDMDPESYARTCEALAVADTRREIVAVRHPTLVVCGDQDGPAFIEAARWLIGALPDARLRWLLGAKHAAVLECPADFVAELTEFLEP